MDVKFNKHCVCKKDDHSNPGTCAWESDRYSRSNANDLVTTCDEITDMFRILCQSI